jgi:hypothetical protein
MSLLPDRADRNTRLYLLRLWREPERAPWRPALRYTDSEAPIGCTDLDAMVAFLMREMRSPASSGDTATSAD